MKFCPKSTKLHANVACSYPSECGLHKLQPSPNLLDSPGKFYSVLSPEPPGMFKVLCPGSRTLLPVCHVL